MKLARLALQLRCAARSKRRQALPALWLLSDSARSGDLRAAICRLPRGAGFIFRHYETPGREKLASELRLLCRRRHILFLIAGDWRIAQRLRADGVHLPEALAWRACAIKARNPGALITAAAHDARALRRAQCAGADAALLSPVFATKSHPGAASLGVVRFARLARHSPIPVIALGGINPSNARGLREGGAIGLAGVSGIV